MLWTEDGTLTMNRGWDSHCEQRMGRSLWTEKGPSLWTEEGLSLWTEGGTLTVDRGWDSYCEQRMGLSLWSEKRPSLWTEEGLSLWTEGGTLTVSRREWDSNTGLRERLLAMDSGQDGLLTVNGRQDFNVGGAHVQRTGLCGPTA